MIVTKEKESQFAKLDLTREAKVEYATIETVQSRQCFRSTIKIKQRNPNYLKDNY